MIRDRIIDEYFEWLIDHLIYSGYVRLLEYLHDVEFRYSIPNDANRAQDGIDLRYRFTCERDYDGFFTEVLTILDGPCSVLEMLLALSIRCEEHIMDDQDIGDRTDQWFWTMITNLDLITMTDDDFDRRIADKKLSAFLGRKYKKNGEGGLFVVEGCKYDLRDVEIWYQMCWYLDNIL